MKIWDLSTGRVLDLRGHTDLVRGLACSPDGRRLATGSDDRTIKLWDTTTGEEVFTLRGHTAGVLCVAFSPDGRRIASGGWDRTVRVWDTSPPASHDAVPTRGRVSGQAPGTPGRPVRPLNGTTRCSSRPAQVRNGKTSSHSRARGPPQGLRYCGNRHRRRHRTGRSGVLAIEVSPSRESPNIPGRSNIVRHGVHGLGLATLPLVTRMLGLGLDVRVPDY